MRASLALALAALAAATDPTYDCEEAGLTISSSITSSGFTVELNDGAAAVMKETVPGGGETYQHRLDSITGAVRTYLQKLSDESDLPFTDVISTVPLRCTTGNIGAANFQYYHSCGCKAIYSLRCDQLLGAEYAVHGDKDIALELLHMSALAYYRSMPDSQPQRRLKQALAASQIVSMVRMRKPNDCTMTDTRPQCCDCGPGSGSGPTCKSPDFCDGWIVAQRSPQDYFAVISEAVAMPALSTTGKAVWPQSRSQLEWDDPNGLEKVKAMWTLSKDEIEEAVAPCSSAAHSLGRRSDVAWLASFLVLVGVGWLLDPGSAWCLW